MENTLTFHPMTPKPEIINLLNYNQAEMRALFVERGEKAFRGTQVFQWLHQHGVKDLQAMSNLHKACRESLLTTTTVELPEIVTDELSTDGTRKWLLRLNDGNSIETVFIPEDDRGTLCVSSQVGCALNCSFCSTGAMGFNRNLSTAEIIGQVWLARDLLKKSNSNTNVTNVVMMGMGEPLLNYDNVVRAMDIMMDDHGYNLSKYRVTLSTSGVVPVIYDLARDSVCALAVSLHAPNDTLRNELVPINKKYPLVKLMDACRAFFADEPRRKVTFEYTMLKGINDSEACARELVDLVADVPCKINLIPFNPYPFAKYVCSEPATIKRFQSILAAADITTMVRKTRGDDIAAACGQLVGQFTDRTRRSQEHRQKLCA